MEKISVSIRVRPLDKQEAAKGILWKINNNSITLCNASGAPLPNHVYIFDNVFGMDSTTLGIYAATTKDIVASAVKGFNGTVLAYGQTSSGKTFTMRGTQDEPGIIPRAIHDVFKNLEEAIDREFLLRMSYMEIYNEEINDLLAPEQTKLQVHESVERGIFVAGLREEIVASPEQVLQLMEFGEAHRHIGETNMNVHSSRSHTIFRMVIESRDKSQDDSLGFSCDAVRVSVLNLVDLAGSERVAKTGAEGTRLKEGTHINKSLMVLGTVINKLSEGIQNQGGHVPYRDSKLTRILQPALGGNARTAVICNITPAMVHVDESRGTLQFASRAIRVTNCAQVNEILTDAALLKRQKKEIEELRCKLKESHSEHFEEEILTLRNTLLKSEYERERIALELQEEKRAHAERERKQAQKIENLSTLVLNSTVDDRDFEKRTKKNARRETWCPRITIGNVLDEDVSKPLKDERWIPQSRDRMFSLPPPFECLLEEDESNNRELAEVHMASSQQQERYGENNDKDLGCIAGALQDRNARIHVADRKRKYSPEMPTVNEDDFQEQLNFFKKLEHGDDVQRQNDDRLQMTESFQNHPLNSEIGTNNGRKLLSNILESQEGNRNLGGQEADTSIPKDFDEEVQSTDPVEAFVPRDLDTNIDHGTGYPNSADQMIQQLLQEQSQTKEETVRYKHQLDSAMFELEQFKVLNMELKASLTEAQESSNFQALRLKDTSSLLEAAESELVLLQKMNETMCEELTTCKESNFILESSISDLKNKNKDLAKNLGNLGAKDSNGGLESLFNDLKREKEELAVQLTEAYLQFEEEKAAWEAIEKPVLRRDAGSKLSMTSVSEDAERVKFWEKKILEVQNEVNTAKLIAEEERLERINKSNQAAILQEKLTELERELDTLKTNELAKELSSIEDGCDGTMICKDAEEFPQLLEGKPRETPEILEVVFQEDQGKDKLRLTSSESTAASDKLETAYSKPNVAHVDDHKTMIKNLEHFKERNHELENLIDNLKQEKEELAVYILELESYKRKVEEFQKEAATANSTAEQERNERVTKSWEVAALQEKMNELEAKLIQESAFREMESRQVSELQKKLSLVEDCLRRNETEYSKEKWKLKTEILKFQVSLDAVTAMKEVFHGRLLEAQDELKDMHEEVDRLKSLHEKLEKDELITAETSKREIPNASVSPPAHNEALKQSCAMTNAATIEGHKMDQRSSEQAIKVLMDWKLHCSQHNTARNGIEHTEIGSIKSNDKEHLDSHPVGSQRKTDQAKILPKVNTANTVSLPVRSTFLKRQNSKGSVSEVQGHSRPLLSAVNVNAAIDNRNTCEVASMPVLGRNSITLSSAAPGSHIGQNPPKDLFGKKNIARSRDWNTHNKENR